MNMKGVRISHVKFFSSLSYFFLQFIIPVFTFFLNLNVFFNLATNSHRTPSKIKGQYEYKITYS